MGLFLLIDLSSSAGSRKTHERFRAYLYEGSTYIHQVFQKTQPATGENITDETFAGKCATGFIFSTPMEKIPAK
jgi:hypothetical protein